MQKKKILLVEDDTTLAQVYKSRLTLEGFEVEHVANGELALSTAIEFKPDLIVLDAMMPKINGSMLTALSQPKDKERAVELGADDYLVKSQVVISDVVDRIKHQLGIQ